MADFHADQVMKEGHRLVGLGRIQRHADQLRDVHH
jgi:hypothetical protein